MAYQSYRKKFGLDSLGDYEPYHSLDEEELRDLRKHARLYAKAERDRIEKTQKAEKKERFFRRTFRGHGPFRKWEPTIPSNKSMIKATRLEHLTSDGAKKLPETPEDDNYIPQSPASAIRREAAMRGEGILLNEDGENSITGEDYRRTEIAQKKAKELREMEIVPRTWKIFNYVSESAGISMWNTVSTVARQVAEGLQGILNPPEEYWEIKEKIWGEKVTSFDRELNEDIYNWMNSKVLSPTIDITSRFAPFAEQEQQRIINQVWIHDDKEDFTEALYKNMSVGMSIAQAVGATVATGSPTIGAYALSATEIIPMYNKMRDEGNMSPEEAMSLTYKTLALHGAVEAIGLEFMFSGIASSLFVHFLLNFPVQMGEEATQTVIENHAAKHGWGETRDFLRQMADLMTVTPAMMFFPAVNFASSSYIRSNMANQIVRETGVSKKVARQAVNEMYTVFEALKGDFENKMASKKIRTPALDKVREEGAKSLDVFITENEEQRRESKEKPAFTPEQEEVIERAETGTTRRAANAKTGETITLNGWSGYTPGKDSGFRSPSEMIARGYAQSKVRGILVRASDTFNNPYATENLESALRELGANELLKELRGEKEKTKGGLWRTNPVLRRADAFVKKRLSEKGYDGVIFRHNSDSIGPEWRTFNTEKTKDWSIWRWGKTEEEIGKTFTTEGEEEAGEATEEEEPVEPEEVDRVALERRLKEIEERLNNVSPETPEWFQLRDEARDIQERLGKYGAEETVEEGEGVATSKEDLETGEPATITVYRGEGGDRRTRFNLGVMGKDAQYFAFTEEDAAKYGDVTRRDVRVENPYVVRGLEDLRQLAKEVGSRIAVWGPVAEEKTMRAEIKKRRDWLLENGYDSIVIDWEGREKRMRNFFDIPQLIILEGEAKNKVDLRNQIGSAEDAITSKIREAGDAYGKAWEQITSAVEMAEGPQRTRTGEEGDKWFKSGYPEWLPSHLRSKSNLEAISEALQPDNITFPSFWKSNRKREAVNAALREVDRIAGIDTSKERKAILDAYQELYGRETAEIVYADMVSPEGVQEEATKNQLRSIKKVHPAVARAIENKLDWHKLSDVERNALKMWANMGREGLPPAMEELLNDESKWLIEKNKKVIVNGKKIDYIDYVKDIKSWENIDPDSPLREFENQNTLSVFPWKAAEVMKEMADWLGYPIVIKEKGKVMSRGKSAARGAFNPNTGKWSVYLRDLTSYTRLAHESTHAYDVIRIGEKGKTFKNLAPRVGLPMSFESRLQEELKRCSLFVRPLHEASFEKSKAGRAFLKYRFGGKKRELVADWGALYFSDRERAISYAPLFTTAMELSHPDFISFASRFRNALKDKTHRNPKRRLGMNKVKSFINTMLGRYEKMDPEIKIDDNEKGPIKKWLYELTHLLPQFKAQSNEYWNEAFRGVVDNVVYLKEGISGQLKKESVLLEFKNEPDSVKRKTAELLFSGDVREEVFSEEDARMLYQAGEKSFYYYKQIRRVLDKCLDLMVEGAKIRTGYYSGQMSKEDRAQLEKNLRESIDRITGYFPHFREGDWMAIAYQEDPSESTILEKGSTVWFNTYKSKQEAWDSVKKMKDKLGYDSVQVVRKKKAMREFVDRQYKYMSVYQLLTLMSDAGVERSSQLGEKLLKHLRSKKVNQRLLERKWVPGYPKTPESVQKAMFSFIDDSVRQYTKALADEKLKSAILSARANGMAETADEISLYRDEVMSATPENLGAFRKALYYWHLTWKASFGVVNLTQTLTTLLPEMANHYGFVRAPIKYAETVKDLTYYWATKKGETEYEWDIRTREMVEKKKKKLSENKELAAKQAQFSRLMDRAFNDNVVNTSFTQEMVGARHPGQKRLDDALTIIARSTETWNKAMSAAAGYKIATETMGLRTDEEIYQLMKEIVEPTQFVYGSSNMPSFIYKLGRAKGIGKTLSVFKTYAMADLGFLTERVAKGSGAAKAWALLSRIGLAGITGLPFWKLFAFFFRKLFGEDPAMLLRKLFGKSREAQDTADILIDGLPSLVGMDFGLMMGQGELLNPQADPARGIFGAPFGTVSRVYYGTRLLAEGNKRGWEYVTPPALGNIIQAARWAGEGYKYTGPSGESIMMDVDRWDVTQRALSFYPHKLSKMYDAKEMETILQKEKNHLKRKIENDIKAGASLNEIMDKYYYRLKRHNERTDEVLYIMYTRLDADIDEDTYKSIYKRYNISVNDVDRWATNALEDKEKRIEWKRSKGW